MHIQPEPRSLMDRLDEKLDRFGQWFARGWRAFWREVGRVFRWNVDRVRDRPAQRAHDDAVRHAARWAMPVAEPPHASAPPPPLPVRAMADRLPYRRAKSLLTKGERAVWFPLFLVVKGRYRIFLKVRLAEVASCPPVRRGQPHWFKWIRGYHDDFVLCEPET